MSVDRWIYEEPTTYRTCPGGQKETPLVTSSLRPPRFPQESKKRKSRKKERKKGGVCRNVKKVLFFSNDQ
jgi:hypothetical protein